uniref:Uncharacterized protein n=1 Tax=Aegilops tauschii subsp. strangulata TaxID=200361 RepID=A0A453KFL9_AEGTS
MFISLVENTIWYWSQEVWSSRPCQCSTKNCICGLHRSHI